MSGVFGLLKRVRILMRGFEAAVALLSLLVTYQVVWIFFHDISYIFRAPSTTVLLLPSGYYGDGLRFARPLTDPIVTSESQIDLTGFGPPDREIALAVNNVVVHSAITYRGIPSFFRDIPLRRGTNEITAYLADEAIDPSELTESRENLSLTVLARPEPKIEPELLGLFDTGIGYTIAIGLAEPSSNIYVGGVDQGQSISTDRIGSFVYYLPVTPGEEVELRASYTDQNWDRNSKVLYKGLLESGSEITNNLGRKVRISVAENATYKILAHAHIPPNSALHEWIRQDQISPIELLNSFFGLSVYPPPGNLWDPRRETEQDVSLTGSEVALELTGKVSPGGSYVEPSWSNELPLLTSLDDEIRLETFDSSRVLPSYPPDGVDGSTWVWRGGSQGGSYLGPDLHIQEKSSSGDNPVLANGPMAANIIDYLSRLQGMTPLKLKQFLEALLTSAPFIWLLWIIRNSKDAVATGYRTTILAVTSTFLIFHLTVLTLPFFSFSFDSLSLLLNQLFGETGDLSIILGTIADISNVYPFWAVGVILLIMPIYHARKRSRTASRLRESIYRQLIYRTVFWLLAATIPIAVVGGLIWFKLQFQELFSYPSNGVLFNDSAPSNLNDLLRVSLGSAGVGLFSSWIFLYWLIHFGVGLSVRLWWITVASSAMLFLPLVPVLFESAAGSARYFVAAVVGIYPFFIPQHVDSVLGTLIISGAGAILLYQFTHLSIRLSQHRKSFLLFRSQYKWAFVVLFLLISLPTAHILGTSQQLPIGVYDLTELTIHIDALLPYALIGGVLLFLKLLNQEDTHELSEHALGIGALLFAFYLTGRAAHLLFIPIPLLLGWYVFRRWVITTPGSMGTLLWTSPTRAIVQPFLDYKQALRWAHSLRSNVEKKYAQGDITLAEMRGKLQDVEQLATQRENALPVKPTAIKQLIFANGPENGPWANARVAVLYGLLFSLPFQIRTVVSSLELEIETFSNFPIFGVLRSVLFSGSFWILTAFVFGYFFHLIRGRDGFEKAIVFSVGLLIALIPLRIIEYQPLFVSSHLIQMVQVIAYLLILALVAFDLRVLQKLGYGWRELLSAHGLTTIMAYGSSIALASAASILGKDLLPLIWELIKWFSSG
jgi:hypothetical protein